MFIFHLDVTDEKILENLEEQVSLIKLANENVQIILVEKDKTKKEKDKIIKDKIEQVIYSYMALNFFYRVYYFSVLSLQMSIESLMSNFLSKIQI